MVRFGTELVLHRVQLQLLKRDANDDRVHRVLLCCAGYRTCGDNIALARERRKGGFLMVTMVKTKIRKTWTLLEVIAHIGIIVTIISMAAGL